jgi:hypothetical protein
MCVPIQRVHRDSTGVLTHIGGSTLNGMPWGLTIAEAAALQEARLFEWFVEVPTGERVSVWVKSSSSGNKYLTTSPDGVMANNLDSLPNMPNPLAGTPPPYPLSIPGPLTASLMRVSSIGYSGNNTLTPLSVGTLLPSATVHEFSKTGAFWRATPRWFYVNAVVPFPAHYGVSLNSLGMEKVSGDNIVRRRELESAGKGWWTLDFVLTRPDGSIDPSKPSRLTEVKVVINPGSRAWAAQNFALSLNAFSANPYCPSHGSGVVFCVRKPAAPSPQPPATTTMPSVTGQRLDIALNTLYGLGLSRVFIFGPVAVSTDLNVAAQNPAAGAVLKLTDSVTLTTSLATPQTGTNKIRINNQSNRAHAVDIWLFDMTTGSWDKKTTVAYQTQEEVELQEGHLFQIAATDATLLNCRSGRPDEISCVYASPQGIFVGDDNGAVIPWQIT